MLCQKLYENGPSFSQSFNFGPNEKDAKNVEWIARDLVETWGEGASYEVSANDSSLHEANFLKLDCYPRNSIELSKNYEPLLLLLL
jgi:CDP-glucose 4,6-dehydratase